MRKHPLAPAQGVSNIELFYDLIFVYCISVLTSLCHRTTGLPDLGTWVIFTFSYLAVLQVWFYTTLFMNRYGEGSATDNVCLFVNMFLLYFLASGIRTDWESTRFTFNLSWALILANLALHWLLKRSTIEDLDEIDLRGMRLSAGTLALMAVLALTAAFLPFWPSVILSWVTLLVGMGSWGWADAHRAKPGRFSHVTERCSLLTIIAFGEMVVGVAGYVDVVTNPGYLALVFALVVGLFLVFIFEHDNMVDHQLSNHGMGFMTVTSWLIVILGNVTVALGYLPRSDLALTLKSFYLGIFIVAYLLTSFVFARYNKPEYAVSRTYALGRAGACAFIAAAVFSTRLHPMAPLICDVAAVYFALWHEWYVYRTRTGLMAFGHALGITAQDLIDVGFDFRTAEGRAAIAEAEREARESMAQTDELGRKS